MSQKDEIEWDMILTGLSSLVQSESQFIYVMLSTPDCLQANMFTSHVRENKIFN